MRRQAAVVAPPQSLIRLTLRKRRDERYRPLQSIVKPISDKELLRFALPWCKRSIIRLCMLLHAIRRTSRTTLPEVLLVFPHQVTPHRSFDPKSLQDRSQLRRNRTPLVRSPLSPRPIQQRHILFDTQRQEALVAGSQATLARLSPKTLSLIDRQRSQPCIARYHRTASLAGRLPPSRQLLRR